MKILKFLKLLFCIFYSIYFFIISLILHITGIILGVLLILFGLRKFVYFLEGIWVRFYFLLGGKIIKIKGIENFNKNENYLIIANHSSFFDIHCLLCVFNGLSFLAKKELMKNPLWNLAIKFSNSVPIDRENFLSSMESLNNIIKNSKFKINICIFPEGTRTKTGKIGNFKKGFIRILKNTNLNLLPVTLNGFYNFKPKNRIYFDPLVKLEVIIHKPLKNEELKIMNENEILEYSRNIILNDYIIK